MMRSEPSRSGEKPTRFHSVRRSPRLLLAFCLAAAAPGIMAAGQVAAASDEPGAEIEQRPGNSKRLSAAMERELAGEMVFIPGGTFLMGDLRKESHLRHLVRRITAPAFKMGKYEVTFAQWDAYLADSGCAGHRPDDNGWGRGDQPVINVSWEDAQGFIRWLNARTGGGYRLPTASEWEYAARAGATTAYSWGDEVGVNRANCVGCGSQWDDKQPAPVGSFPANGWGLHDMHGNVEEWVQDCLNYHYKGAPADGSAWISEGCHRRMLRGGSWPLGPHDLVSSADSAMIYALREIDTGFRLAQDL